MWLKFELYIVSLFLLFLLLFINKVPYCIVGNCEWVSISSLFKQHLVVTICVIFMIAGIIFFARFNHNILEGATNLPVQVTNVENLNYENITFLATYIVPLVCFDLDFNLDENRNLLMLFCVLVLIGAIYLKTNMFYTNPTLAIMGFQIYKINTLKHQDVVIIIRGKVKKDSWLYCKHISGNIYYAKLKQ